MGAPLDLTIPPGGLPKPTYAAPVSKWKGWRTVAVNVALPAGVLLLQNLAGVDFGKLGVGMFAAIAIHSGINIALRAITNTAIGKAT